jgi:membrane dipeptidase
MTQNLSFFDGHNDVLLRFYLDKDGDPIAKFLNGSAKGHINLPQARDAGLFGGMFAVFSPSREPFDLKALQGASYDVPLPSALDVATAQASALKQISLLFRLEAESNGAIVVCRDAAQIRSTMQQGSLAIVLHMEGACAIDGDLAALDVLYAAGLRSLGPVWSRPNHFAHGVPLKFPSPPDTGEGLSELGRDLVRACNRLGVLIDLSHLNEKGFWDIAKLSTAPLVATHSNVHAICPTPRNLTDRQLDAIRETEGFVGLNFATSYLRPDGQMRADTDVEWMVRHLDALIEKLGENGVGLGSDFDGAIIPAAIGDVRGLPRFFEVLQKHGYNENLLKRIASENWLSVLERTIG